MEKNIIISEDTKAIENLQRLSVAYNLEFNAVLKTIRLFTKIDSREAFLKAYRNLKQVVIDEAIEGLPKTLKVLKKEALESMVEVPEQLPEALRQIESLKSKRYSSDIFNCLDLEKDFEISQDKFEALLDIHRIRITEPKQIEKYNELKKITDAINEAGLIQMGNIGGLLSNFHFKEGVLHPAVAVVQRAV